MGHRREDHTDVTDEAEIDVPVLADSAVVHIDLHHGRVFRQPPAVAHPEVERRADDYDHVRVVDRVPPRQMEVVRVPWRQRASTGTVHERRNVERPAETDRGLRGPTRPHLRSEQYTGLFRPG